MRTLALLDTGGDRSYCTKALAKSLSAGGFPTTIEISTLGHETRTAVVQTHLRVQGTRGQKRKTIIMHNVLVVPELPQALKSHVAQKEEVNSWSHLRDLELTNGNLGGVDLLIGLDNPLAMRPLEVRRAGDGEPFAVRTALGWTVNGPLIPTSDRTPAAHTCLTILEQEGEGNSAHATLEEQVRLFWEMEEPEMGIPEREGLSVDDRAVLRLWDETGGRWGSHYVFPIPFKEDTESRLDNRQMAERRLNSLRPRLSRHPGLRERYAQEINKLLMMGYAEKIPVDQLFTTGRKIWYLPHHPVFNPRKPEKTRVVFDCAATQDGISLNSQVRQGPDLNNKLLGVLIRFREEPIAVTEDIEAMFHQVRVAEEHKDALRFLWWEEPSLMGKPTTFRMTVHLFGGAWSPSCAAYALQKTFKDYGMEHPPGVEGAVKNFYVDDLLLSTTSVTKAMEMVRELIALLEKGAFD